jgi:hypothetical protein
MYLSSAVDSSGRLMVILSVSLAVSIFVLLEVFNDDTAVAADLLGKGFFICNNLSSLV